MKAATLARARKTSILIAALTLATTACSIEMAMGSGGDLCMSTCGDWDFDWVATDSIDILQRDTTITLTDSLLVRVNVYPDSAAFHILADDPYGSAQITWIRKEGRHTHIWKVKPLTTGTIRLRASDYGPVVVDSMALQVTP